MTGRKSFAFVRKREGKTEKSKRRVYDGERESAPGKRFLKITSRNLIFMTTRVLSPSFKEEEVMEEKEAMLFLNSLEEKYAKALSSGCRKKRSELLFLRSDENDENRRRRFGESSGGLGREEEGTTKAEDKEEEEGEEEKFFELDAKALFAPSPLSSVALLRSGKVSSSDDDENEDNENENKKNKKLLLVRREKIRETNVRLDENVRNVRDLLERLKTNHYYSSEKATSFSSATLLGRESEFFEKQQDNGEEDFYEEEEFKEEEESKEDRTRRRQLLLLQNHLLLPMNAEIAGVNATTQTTRTKKTEDWSVPAEDLVLLSSFRDDDENNENNASSPTAESLRAAGIIF